MLVGKADGKTVNRILNTGYEGNISWPCYGFKQTNKMALEGVAEDDLSEEA